VTPVLPRWADIPNTKTDISPSQVNALPPAGTALALDLAGLLHAGEMRILGDRQDKEGRVQQKD